MQKVFIHKKSLSLMKWKTIKKYFPILGLGLFIYLLFKLDVTKIFQVIGNANFFYILVALLVTGVFFITQTLKWYVIARKQRINVPFREAFKINFISNFYGFVTPAKLGSVMRVSYLKKHNADTGKGLSNFVIDKVLDLGSLFVLTLGFGFIFYGKKISSIFPHSSQIIVIALFLLFIFISLIFYKKEVIKPLAKRVYNIFIPKKMKEKGKVIFNSFYEDMPSLGFLSFAFILNLINWIVDYALIYFVGLSLGINIGFIPFLVILPITTLIAQIPITINGLGTRELTMISLFGLFGVDAVKIFSMSLIGMIIANIIPAIIVMIFIYRKEK